jgi:GntR family transcriptional regulator, transcriptional repressor for pyruvate dehydrogenase complex
MARRPSALPEKIAQDLMRRILANEFADALLPSERALQDSYGVSRTVVREALKLLAARGLITTGSGQGAVISTNLTAPAVSALALAFHRADARLEDLLNARLLIEPAVAALAAQHATSLQIRSLHDLAHEMAELGTVAPPVQAANYSNDNNARFHTLLAAASQNPVLEVIIELMVGIVWHQQYTVNHRETPERYRLTAEQHLRIVRAVEARDPGAARQAMADHLEHTRKSLSDPSGTMSALVKSLYYSE